MPTAPSPPFLSRPRGLVAWRTSPGRRRVRRPFRLGPALVMSPSFSAGCHIASFRRRWLGGASAGVASALVELVGLGVNFLNRADRRRQSVAAVAFPLSWLRLLASAVKFLNRFGFLGCAGSSGDLRAAVPAPAGPGASRFAPPPATAPWSRLLAWRSASSTNTTATNPHNRSDNAQRVASASMSADVPAPAAAMQEWLDRWDAQQEAHAPDRPERFDVLADLVESATAGRSDPLVLDLACGPAASPGISSTGWR